MRGTRAYIASAGTAVVMLGASLCTFVLVGAFVAFGSWPGEQSHTKVDQLLLRDVVRRHPKNVAVRADAVVVARKAERRAAAVQRRVVARTAPGTPLAPAPKAGTGPAAPTGQAQAQAPAPAAPAAPSEGQPAAPIRQQAQDLTQNIDSTTRTVTTPVQEQVQTLQNQVNEVVTGVTGGPPPPSVVPGVVNTVTDTAGSVLGH